MATISIVPIRRNGLHFFREAQVFECAGCLEKIPVYSRVIMDPEAFVEARERAEEEHRGCWGRTVADAQARRRAAREKSRGEVVDIRSRKAMMLNRAMRTLGMR